jgi:hypothetical protein
MIMMSNSINIKPQTPIKSGVSVVFNDAQSPPKLGSSKIAGTTGNMIMS